MNAFIVAFIATDGIPHSLREYIILKYQVHGHSAASLLSQLEHSLIVSMSYIIRRGSTETVPLYLYNSFGSLFTSFPSLSVVVVQQSPPVTVPCTITFSMFCKDMVDRGKPLSFPCVCQPSQQREWLTPHMQTSYNQTHSTEVYLLWKVNSHNQIPATSISRPSPINLVFLKAWSRS